MAQLQKRGFWSLIWILIDFALCYLSDLLSVYCSVLLSCRLLFSSLQVQVSPASAWLMLFLFLILILSSSWGVYVYSNSYMILVWNNMQHCYLGPSHWTRKNIVPEIYFPLKYPGLSVQLLEQFSKYGSVLEIDFEKRSSAMSSQSNWCP